MDEQILNELFGLGKWLRGLVDGPKKPKKPQRSPYINPDDILVGSWTNSGRTKLGIVGFVYGPNDTLIYGETPSSTHYEMIVQNAEHFGYTDDDYLDFYEFADEMREQLLTTALLGRLGNYSGRGVQQARIVAFWNRDASLYYRLLPKCIQQLKHDGHINDDSYVSTPGYGLEKITQSRLLNRPHKVSSQPKQGEPAISDEELELRMKLHTMPAQAKKQFMKYFGMNTQGKKSEWQSAAEKEGIVQPGQKWWAMTSDDIDRLNQALVEYDQF